MASPIAGSAYTFTISLISQTDGSIVANPTINSGDVTVSTDGGAATLIASLPTVTPASSGIVEVNLTSNEVGNDHFTVRFSDITGAQWKDTNYHETVQSNETPTPGGIADAVWDELQAGHTIAGSFGEYLDAKVSEAGGSGGASYVDGPVIGVVVDNETIIGIVED